MEITFPKLFSSLEKQFCQDIHRMQIWRTTRSAPGTSCKNSVIARDELHESEASEASMFCFDNASPEKSSS